MSVAILLCLHVIMPHATCVLFQLPCLLSEFPLWPLTCQQPQSVKNVAIMEWWGAAKGVGGCSGRGRRGRSRGMERTFNSKHVSRIRTLFVAVALGFCFAILSLAFLSMHKCTGRNTLGVSPSHALLLTQLGCFKPLAGLK